MYLAIKSVSKFGITGLTKIMALEYAPNKIRINAVAPTGIETEMIRKWMEAQPGKGSYLQKDINDHFG